jgi:kynurenine formamidase
MKRRIYDLSMPFTRDMPTFYFWKNWHHPPFFATFSDLAETSLGPGTGEGFVTLVSFLTHTGTHMDSPRHFRRDRWYLHEIPPDRLLGEGPVLDVPKGPNEDITVRDLEATGAAVRRGDLVAINTGWHRRYLTPGQDREGAHFYFTQHPGLCTESAQWLVERGAVTVLIDTPAIDSAPHTVFGDETWQAHAGLFEHNIPVVEHLGGEIDEVAGRRCIISCAPVKYVHGDAFPLRALAWPLE